MKALVRYACSLCVFCCTAALKAQSPEVKFNGLDVGLHNIFRLSDAESRSISPENFTGEKGKGAMATEGTNAHAARDLGQGWKVSPSVDIRPGQEFVVEL